MLAKISIQQTEQNSLNQQHTRRISNNIHSSKKEGEQEEKRQQRQRERELVKEEGRENVEEGKSGTEPEVLMERKYGLRSQEGKQRAEFIAKRTRSYLDSLEKRPR